MSQFFFTYVLLSKKDGMFYTGYTQDLHIRLSQHNAGDVPSTSHRGPMKLIYFEACRSKVDALNRERYLKTGMGKRYIRNRLKNYVLGDKDISFYNLCQPDLASEPRL